MFRRQQSSHMIDSQQALKLLTTAAQQITILLRKDESVESLYQYLIQIAARIFGVDSRFLFIRIADPDDR